MNIENYYKEVICNFTDEDSLVYFLNDKDILAKFDDDQREYFITQWLIDHGYVELHDHDDSAE